MGQLFSSGLEEKTLALEEKELEEKKQAQEKELEEKKLAQEKEFAEKRLAQEKELAEKRLAQERELSVPERVYYGESFCQSFYC
jgi:flagellar biosynthesis GTPase FlhF